MTTDLAFFRLSFLKSVMQTQKHTQCTNYTSFALCSSLILCLQTGICAKGKQSERCDISEHLAVVHSSPFLSCSPSEFLSKPILIPSSRVAD